MIPLISVWRTNVTRTAPESASVGCAETGEKSMNSQADYGGSRRGAPSATASQPGVNAHGTS